MCKLRASRVRVPVAGTGCVGIACCGSLAQIMQGLLPKYVFCHCFLFSGARELPPKPRIHGLPHLLGCGGEAAVEGAGAEETGAGPGRLPPGGVEVEGGVSAEVTGLGPSSQPLPACGCSSHPPTPLTSRDLSAGAA